MYDIRVLKWRNMSDLNGILLLDEVLEYECVPCSDALTS
jgi:hypothetical protein